MCLTHIYNFKSIFNFTVTRLSWHVLCYLISKNLYSLQNVQPFIFQLICMQLRKCINCFPKAQNKQLNQYCLNFTIFYQKKVLKKWFRSSCKSGWVNSQKHGSGHGSTRFYFGLKKSGSGQVFFGSGQIFLTHFAMSTCDVGTVQCEDGTIKCEKKVREPSNVRKELSHVMLELHNVRIEPSSVRKK